MLVPVNWLKKYVNIDDIEIKTLEERLIMSGSNTETVEAVAGQINKIVVASAFQERSIRTQTSCSFFKWISVKKSPFKL